MTVWNKLFTTNWNVDIDTLPPEVIHEFLRGQDGTISKITTMFDENKVDRIIPIYLNDRKTRQRYFADQAAVTEWETFFLARVNQFNLQGYLIDVVVTDV